MRRNVVMVAMMAMTAMCATVMADLSSDITDAEGRASALDCEIQFIETTAISLWSTNGTAELWNRLTVLPPAATGDPLYRVLIEMIESVERPIIDVCEFALIYTLDVKPQIADKLRSARVCSQATGTPEHIIQNVLFARSQLNDAIALMQQQENQLAALQASLNQAIVDLPLVQNTAIWVTLEAMQEPDPMDPAPMAPMDPMAPMAPMAPMDPMAPAPM